MKPSLLSAFVVLGGILFAASLVVAAELSRDSGDLLLCFRKAGSPNNYLVKLGPASKFQNLSGATPVAGLGNIKQDLIDVFGKDWGTDPEIFWSVSGTTGLAMVGTDPARTVYATKQQALLGTPEPSWNRASTSAQGVVDTKLRALGSAYAANAGVPNSSTANSEVGLVQPTTAINSYSSFQTGSISFSYFNGGIEGSFSNGTANSRLDLFRMTPGSGFGDHLGTLGMDDNGVLTFTPPTTSPTPTFDAAIASIVRSGAAANLTGSGTPNASYQIQRSADLKAWTSIGTLNADPSGGVSFSDSAAPAGLAFYRIATP